MDTQKTLSNCGKCGKTLDVTGFRTPEKDEAYVCKKCAQEVQAMKALYEKMANRSTEH